MNFITIVLDIAKTFMTHFHRPNPKDTYPVFGPLLVAHPSLRGRYS